MKPYDYRAVYKRDLDNGLYLPFYTKIVNEKYGLMFVGNDGNFRYLLECVFTDDDWIKERYVGWKDTEDKRIYEGDIIEYFEVGKKTLIIEHYAREMMGTEFSQKTMEIGYNFPRKCNVVSNIHLKRIQEIIRTKGGE
ncbi:MAG: hypothetical protein KKB59_18890 [Spirochaetes bacterium]|nr:hypothetical protein [Spirochaetota bacterium]